MILHAVHPNSDMCYRWGKRRSVTSSRSHTARRDRPHNLRHLLSVADRTIDSACPMRHRKPNRAGHLRHVVVHIRDLARQLRHVVVRMRVRAGRRRMSLADHHKPGLTGHRAVRHRKNSEGRLLHVAGRRREREAGLLPV